VYVYMNEREREREEIDVWLHVTGREGLGFVARR
jgi:hypothetical protein